MSDCLHMFCERDSLRARLARVETDTAEKIAAWLADTYGASRMGTGDLRDVADEIRTGVWRGPSEATLQSFRDALRSIKKP
jgi:hypothetical protein